MPIVTEKIEKWNGVVTNPFSQNGAGLMHHLNTVDDNSMIYPSNSRVLASTKFGSFPSTAKRAVNIQTLGAHALETAILTDGAIVFIQPFLLTLSTVSTGVSTVSDKMFFEFDGGLYFSDESSLTVYRFDLTTNTTTTITAGSLSTYVNAYGTPMSNKNIGVIAANYGPGCVLYRLDFNLPSKPNANITPITGARLSANCVSMDEYKNYTTALLTKSQGSIVAFWDGESAKCSYIESLPQGQPLFIRSVAGYLVVATLDINVNNVSLIFSYYDGDKFVPAYTYTKFNPISKVVNIKDSSAEVDDGVIFFTGDFCGESGIWTFDIQNKDLKLVSYNSNAGTSPNFATYNTVILPSTIGLSVSDNGAYMFQKTNNDFSNVTPVYVTKRFSANEKRKKKKWLSVGLSTHTDFDESGSEPVIKTVTISYRTDNETSWIPLGVHTASSTPFTEFTFENTGGITIQDYHSIQFKLEWGGLVYVDEFYVKHDLLPQIEI